MMWSFLRLLPTICLVIGTGIVLSVPLQSCLAEEPTDDGGYFQPYTP